MNAKLISKLNRSTYVDLNNWIYLLSCDLTTIRVMTANQPGEALFLVFLMGQAAAFQRAEKAILLPPILIGQIAADDNLE